MRFVSTFIILILSIHGQIYAQERDTLVEIKAIDKSGNLPEYIGKQMHPDAEPMPVFFQDFRQGSEFRNPVLPVMNFNLMKGWKIETGSSIGLKSLNSFPFRNNMTGFYGRSVWDFYRGSYGIRTYEVNNKLYFGTAGYSDKSFNEYSLKSGIYRQTNYSSSLFVGYRFSEKFSISAGLTIQRNNDPLNRNQPMQNGGIFP
ncbi:MAG: hypothetical protein NTY07_17780 [Bacteroidia bacterium]|nr:hypothetical protein [Bacteroidia bacterium]